MADQTYAFPTSFAQRRLWFIDQLVPGNPAYTLHCTVPLKFRLNIPQLRSALNEIVRRHDTLRTTFDVTDGEPLQIVHSEPDLPLPVTDLQEMDDSAKEAEVPRLAAEEAQRPFDLRKGPLIRTALLKLREDHYVLLLTLHHIVADGWSLGIFFNELKEIYGALIRGRPSPLPELPIQYADFAVWQRDRLRGEVLAEQLAYWRERLANLLVLQMPTDRRRPPVASFRGDSHIFRLPASLMAELKHLSRREGVTLFMTLLAAFKVLLCRYTGQEEIVIGSPIANRNRAEIEGLIGFFVNTLVLRTDLSGDPTFVEALARVREVTLGAYAHQDLPFEKLVEDLRPGRDLSRNPLFQVAFQIHNEPTIAVPVAGDAPVSPEVQRGTSNFDLLLDLWETPQGLMVRLNYSTDLFDAATMVRLAGHYRVLLEAIASNPQQCISELPLLTQQERRQLLYDWNDTAADYPRQACIHQLFEEWAARTPEATAVVFENERITYEQLNRRANRIARMLQARGVRADSLVGICLARSVELIAGLLGILKAGAAYVALDPDYPARRLALVIGDGGIMTVLTERRLAVLFDGTRVEAICLDDAAAIAGWDGANPSSDATAESLAYVAYTSGSTGAPKGVCVSHRAVARLVRQNNCVDFGPHEIFLQFSPIPFDASTFEIWGSLLNGARLVVHPAGSASLEELGRTIERHGVTTLWLTAGLFNQMVDHQAASLRGVRQLLAGGEALSAAHVKKALQVPGRRVLINGYGPTEATTFTCCHRMTDASRIGETVPIGKPIANTRVYILDSNLNPVPASIPGELYIGGDGLARGYLNCPELNAEKFVPDHLSGHPGQRLYRTGDLVRYGPDGAIEFLGRIDRQVKLRGFRVEPGEVEAVLLRHPSVRSVAVVAVGEGADKRLVAYVVLLGSEINSSPELRSFLQDQLPAYMIPAQFVAVAEIPLTRHGKVDERLLPAPKRAGAADDTVAPSGEVEVALAQIWSEVLKLEGPDARANFFTDLGGHSLLATQVVSRIREAFGVELPLRRFFESPTVAELAMAVEELLIAEIEMMSEDQVQRLLM